MLAPDPVRLGVCRSCRSVPGSGRARGCGRAGATFRPSSILRPSSLATFRGGPPAAAATPASLEVEVLPAGPDKPAEHRLEPGVGGVQPGQLGSSSPISSCWQIARSASGPPPVTCSRTVGHRYIRSASACLASSTMSSSVIILRSISWSSQAPVAAVGPLSSSSRTRLSPRGPRPGLRIRLHLGLPLLIREPIPRGSRSLPGRRVLFRIKDCGVVIPRETRGHRVRGRRHTGRRGRHPVTMYLGASRASDAFREIRQGWAAR